MPITYTITLDSTDDGTYNEDITSDVLHLKWQLGMTKPYDTLAAISKASIRVVNDSGRYDDLAIGTALKIQSQKQGENIIPHFIGVVMHTEPTTGTLRRPEALITVMGQENALTQHEVRLPPMLNVRADEAISAILQATPIRRFAYAVYCLIEDANAVINSTSIFPPEPLPQQFETGKSVFAYLGDTWANGIRADSAIQQITKSENGHFFINREGEAVFYNRHHSIMNETAPTVFDNDMVTLEYIFGADRINDVRVQVSPRSIGAANSQLWSLNGAMRLQPNSTQTITAQFAIGERTVGALVFITPQRNVHYIANSKDNGTGNDKTSDIEITVTDLSFSAVELTIRNTSNQTRYLTQLELRGTPLITGNAIFISERDPLAMYQQGKQALDLRLPLLSTVEEAGYIAQYELLRRTQPRGVVSAMEINTQSHPTRARSLTLFDTVTVRDAQTGHEADYIIIGEQHDVNAGGTQHHVCWVLEPDERALFFVINRHAVNDSTRVMLPR